MKHDKPTYPNRDDDSRPEWAKKLCPLFSAAEDVDGEGARPSSLVVVYRPKVIDPLHELNLLRMMQMANERTVRERGTPLPSGLPVRKKRKPTAPYTDFLVQVAPDEHPIVEENDEMNLKQAIGATALIIGTAACNSATPIAESVSSNATKAMMSSATPSDQADAKEKHAIFSLRNLLSEFAAPNKVAWSAFDAIPGVTWNDPKMVRNSEASDTEKYYYRSGKLLLAGFGVTDMPNGKVGIDFGLVKGNEGEAGVTLIGDADHVHSISLMKFYPTENFQDILQKQLQTGDSFKLIADHCEIDEYRRNENTSKNKFYEIQLPAGLVYAEISVNEDEVSTASASALGSTLFDFYRNKPLQRIVKMRCHEL